jgi:hypothetical protein
MAKFILLLARFMSYINAATQAIAAYSRDKIRSILQDVGQERPLPFASAWCAPEL